MNNSQVFVSVQNLAPSQGTRLTPVWVGFHGGAFDTYDRGRPASPGVERLAEDGSVNELAAEFSQSQLGGTQGTVTGQSGPIDIEQTVGMLFSVENVVQRGRYFNYAAMLLPSNDFFIANGDPMAHEIFDDHGKFLGADFVVKGSAVLDAGTEVSDEIPENTAFLGQTVPNTGIEERGTVQLAPGFIEEGTILNTEQFSQADFTTTGYQVARIRVLNAVVGTSQNDQLWGSAADDYLTGKSGNDELVGRRGNDVLLGGLGDDWLSGRAGSDELFGHSGLDTLLGGSGNDILDGGEGENLLRGGLATTFMSCLKMDWLLFRAFLKAIACSLE